MIKQAAKGLDSRSEANPFNKDGFLPLITAPMYSVVDKSNYQVFLDNKIQVCLPRQKPIIGLTQKSRNLFVAISLSDFKLNYCDSEIKLNTTNSICIDTANGNMPALHDAIRKAKKIHGSNLVIMAGNVASVEAFVELAKTGVDYIRVGIGGGGGCNTTSNTGVGQENLKDLIGECYQYKKNYPSFLRGHEIIDRQQVQNINNVKIVADGISSYIKFCEKEYGFNDNGYAAINSLLFAGSDLVMIGGLFAQCVESAGEKGFQNLHGVQTFEQWNAERKQSGLFNMPSYNSFEEVFKTRRNKQGMLVKYSGMSTQEEQLKYKPIDDEKVLLSPSEGSVSWIPVRWSLSEWLNGSDNQDQYPYLMGWINSIKSAMSYTGIKILNNN